MAEGLIHFTPRAELDAQANMTQFIELCRTAPVLGAAKQFEKNIWEPGTTLKGKNGAPRVIFSTFEAAKADRPTPALPEPFLAFGKAVLVYLQDKRPVVSQAQRLTALRCLEAALRAHARDRRPTAVSQEVLDTAVDLAKRSGSQDVAYRVAGQLQLIADLMREKKFVRMTSRWVHGMSRPSTLGSRIDEEALKARREKLPSPAAIRGLAGVFRGALGVADTMISASATLMICAPERINEITRLRRNCLVEGEAEYEGKLGLRWSGSKGAADHVKWIPTQMAGIAREAICRLEESSRGAHEVASWYVENPRSIYLSEAAAHLRGQELLSFEDVSLALWGPAGGKAAQWCKGQQITPVKDGRAAGKVRFEDLERAVLAMLPPSFPYLPGDGSPVRADEALCVMFKNQLHPARATYACMFDLLEQGDIGARLGQRDNSGITSLFTKYGFTEDDGSPIVVNSHAFRHYLNTLAQMGGLSDVEIAVFSGRADVRQNQVYDHMTSDQAQAPVHAATKEHGFMTGLVKSPERRLVNRSEHLGAGAGHTTEYGHCTHDFASEPCQMHRDCLNCEEQECVKGDAHKEANLRARIHETRQLLGAARAALNDEEFGADRWVKHQEKTLKRAEALLEILLDPATPVGARIRLASEDLPTPIGHAVSPAAKSVSVRNTRALT